MERRYVGVQVRGFYFGIPGVVIYLQEVKINCIQDNNRGGKGISSWHGTV